AVFDPLHAGARRLHPHAIRGLVRGEQPVSAFQVLRVLAGRPPLGPSRPRGRLWAAPRKLRAGPGGPARQSDLMVKTIEWTPDGVVMIDQTKLPAQEVYVTCKTYQEVAEAIRSMVIRGAPAIGVAAAMGVALGMQSAPAEDFDGAMDAICSTVAATRRTGVNLFWAIERMKRAYQAARGKDAEEVRVALVREVLAIYVEDIAINEQIGRVGASLVPDSKTVLTHCNAGALATAGYGTALGVIRAAVSGGKQIDVMAGETRPYLQGARLTVWGLAQDGIPATLITDSMAGHF